MVNLAERLRSLRTDWWPSRRVTQIQLGAALNVSSALISSWESVKSSVVPPTHRLEAYARFFATERSVIEEPYRLLGIKDLTGEERAQYEFLFRELMALSGSGVVSMPPKSLSQSSMLRFPAGESITIVCSALPQARLAKVPYSNPDEPDYVRAYRYADLDALLDVHGHIRAANPSSPVQVCIPAEMNEDDYGTNIVALGGVDWNAVTKSLLSEQDIPVRQIARTSESAIGGFEVDDKGKQLTITPVMQSSADQVTLIEDVAQFYRSTNPWNRERTVTICNGMHQSGTFGVVRALTDARFQEGNDKYIQERFSDVDTFSIICRVEVVQGAVNTPDWTKSNVRLHEWP